MKRIFALHSLLLIALLVVPHTQAMDIRLKLSGGQSFFSLQNINRPLEDWTEWVKKDTDAHTTWTFLEGEASALRTGFVFSGELMISITSRIAVGLGAGYTYAALDEDRTALKVEKETGTYLYVNPIKISALPITFSGYYYFPLSSQLRLYVTGGAGAAWGKYIDRSGTRLTTKDKYSYQAFQQTSGTGIIILAGSGLEYAFEPGIRFFIEGSARMCQIRDLDGENKQKETGALYYFEEYIQDFGMWQAKNKILPQVPEGDSYRAAQKAVIDLTGFSLIIGLIFKF